MRALRLSIALALVAAGVHAQVGEVQVRYRTADAVYLDGGRAAGLAEGTRLNVVASGAVVAEIEVTFVAEHSASCRVISEKGKIAPGQRVVRVGGPTPPEAAPPSAAAPAAPPVPSPEAPAPAAARSYEARPWGRASGSVSVGWMRLWDQTPLPPGVSLLGTTTAPAKRDLEERTGRVDVDLRELGGQPVGFRLRARLRDDARSGASGVNLPQSARDDRLYEAAVRYQPPSGRLRAEAGRLGGAIPFSIGILDGAMAELRVAPVLYVGGVAGRGADAGWLASGSSATRYGAFVRLTPRGTLSEALVSLLRDGSRDRAAVESRLRSGDVRFTERIQVEHAQDTTRVTDVFASAVYRAAPSTSLSISYDRQRTLALRDEAVPLDQALREALRQGLRASIDVQTKGALGGYVSGGLRMQEGEVEHAWSASGGLRHPHVLGLSASADGSYYVNRSTSGVLATARAGRIVRDRHSIDLSYVYSSYTLRAATSGDRKTQQWLRLSGLGIFGRGAFGRADLEYAHGQDLQGPRAFLEVGYRF
ncbi:MAG: hypothetical protein ACHQKZ_04005 [Solirubrobacterales bacterium]